MVEKNEIVAGTRAIPLVIETAVVEKAVQIDKVHGGLVSVKPLRRAKIDSSQ